MVADKKEFKVGQKWRTRDNEIVRIDYVGTLGENYPVHASNDLSYNTGGIWQHPEDLVELVEDVMSGEELMDEFLTKTERMVRDGVYHTEHPEALRYIKENVGNFIKHDSGKAPLSFLADFMYELGEVSHVMSYGAEKYSRNNWKKCDDTTRYYDAALRHMMAYAGGEYNDPESGRPHAAHAICCLLFAMFLDAEKGNDK